MRADQVQAAYAALGQFLQEFGHAVFSLQLLVVSLLQLGGLRDEGMAWVVVGHRAMHPKDLVDLAQQLIGHRNGGQAEPIFTSIASRFCMLNDQRNDLVHGLTWIGWGNQQTTDWSQFEAYKLVSSKQGSETRDLPHAAEEYQRWVAEAQEIAALVRRYTRCLGFGRDLEKSFVQRGKRWCISAGTPDPSARLG